MVPPRSWSVQIDRRENGGSLEQFVLLHSRWRSRVWNGAVLDSLDPHHGRTPFAPPLARIEFRHIFSQLILPSRLHEFFTT